MEKLLKLAEEILKEPVTIETSQTNCEKWDSLRHINLIVSLEEAYNVSFEPEEIAEMKSMAVIQKIIHAKTMIDNNNDIFSEI